MNNHAVIFAEERQAQILSILKRNKKVLVNDLCKTLEVSAVTVRNDLTDLESKGLLTRTHGGAILNSKATFEEISSQKEVKNIRQKQAIAAKAIQYMEDGDTIALDTGTTTMVFAEQLVAKKGLTVITSDLKIALFLEENSDANIILLGGMIRQGYHCSVGPIAQNAIESLFVDKCFMATNGLTVQQGLSTPNLDQAEIKRLMIRHSNQIFVLCSGEKVGRNSLVSVAPAEVIHVLITDEYADANELAKLNDLNIEIDCVKTRCSERNTLQ